MASALVVLALVVPVAAGAAEIAEDRVVISAERPDDGAAALAAVASEDDWPVASRSLSSLTARVPNLQVQGGGAGSFGDLLTYRGLTNTPYFSDPAVTVYLDDLPLPGTSTNPALLAGFPKAAFARGPQGSTFGRSGTAGVLSLFSEQPGESAGMELRASAGSYDARGLLLGARTVSAYEEAASPVDATLTASLSRRDGYIRNERIGARVNDLDSSSVSARVRWRTGEASRLAFQFLTDRHADGAQPLVPLDGLPYSIERDREGRTDIHLLGLAMKGELDTSAGRLSSITSHTDWKLEPYDNHMVLPPALDSRISQRQRAWNEELRFVSAPGDALQWSAGGWFSRSTTAGDVTRSIPNLFPIESSVFELESRSTALFGEARRVLGDAWSLMAGLRIERTERSFDRQDRLAFQGPGMFTSSRTFDAFLPRLALTYSASARTSITASLSRGAKAGGWSAYTGDPELAAFAAERTTALELSFSTRLRNDTIDIVTRMFAYDTRDYQIERSFTEVDYLVANAPRARSTGAEIELKWRPGTQFSAGTSIGATRSVLREFADPFSGMRYSGNRTPYAPAFDARVNVAWHANGWFAAADATAVGRTFFDEAESSRFAQRARVTSSARAGYEAARWRITAFGENLTAERYYTLIVPGVLHGVPAAPRTWGVEFTVRVGDRI